MVAKQQRARNANNSRRTPVISTTTTVSGNNVPLQKDDSMPNKKRRKQQRNRNRRQQRSQNFQSSGPGGGGGAPMESAEVVAEAIKDVRDLAWCIAALTAPDKVTKLPRYTGGGTALATSTIQNSKTLSVTNEELVGAGGFQVFQFGKPGVNTIVCQTPPTGFTWDYQANFYPFPTPPDSNPGTSSNCIFSSEAANEYFPIRSLQWEFVSGTFQKDDMTYTGQTSKKYPGRSFVFLEAKEKYKISWTGADVTSSNGIKLKAEMWRDGVLTNSQHITGSTVADTPGSMTYVPLTAGRWTFSIMSSEQNQLLGVQIHKISDETITRIHRQLCLADYCDNLTKISAGLVISHQIKLSNATPDINLGGDQVAAQISKSRDWMDFESFDAIASVRGYSQDVAKRGFNGQSRDEAKDLKFSTFAIIAGPANAKRVMSLYDDIESDRPFFAVALALPSGGNQSIKLNMTNAFGVLSEDKFTSGEIGNIKPEVWERAIAETKQIPQFTQNESHFSIIAKGITRAVKGAVNFTQKAVPKVIKGAKMAAELAAIVGPMLL